MRIAIDAMGGDAGPSVIVDGALVAARHLQVGLLLVGDARAIEAELARHPVASLFRRIDVEIIDAPDCVGMAESAAQALRRKPRASIKVAAEAVRDGRADALFSAGHTGASVMAAHAAVGLLPGVDRPALATIIPTRQSPAVLLDAGATVGCRPPHLVQFAVMGSAYARVALGLASPRVGLLSVGEEESKGNELTREAHQLLKGAPVNFIGNVEGRDLPAGATEHHDIDVVVCDGFVGNVLLKFYEAIAPLMIETLRKAGVDGAQLEAGLKHLDYSEHGGAPLLGVRGVSIIAHGKSSPRAIKNALRAAAQAVTSGMNERIGQRLGAATESAA